MPNGLPEPERLQGPPGLVPEGSREPYSEEGMFHVGPEQPKMPAEQRQRGAEPRDETVAWRPVAQYVGTISADTEIGLCRPPFSDVRVMRVGFMARGTVSVSTTDYWTITVKLRDEQGTAEDAASFSTEDYETTANVGIDVFHKEKQLRVQANNELTVAFTKTGSPSPLTQVQVYADLYVGI